MMRRTLALAAFIATPATAQVPVVDHDATITEAVLPQPALVELEVTAQPTGPAAQLDVRVLNGECHLNTNYLIDKSDCLSAYLFNNGADLTYGYGGTLQAWGQQSSTNDYLTGGMFAARTLDTSYAAVARGSRSIADNRRTGSTIAMNTAIGAQSGVLNYGRIGTASGAEAFVQNFAGAQTDYLYGFRLVIDNAGAAPQVYGFRIDTYNQPGASIGGYRAIYITQPTGAAPTGQNWTIYSLATAPSYFAGDIRVGSTSAQGLQAQLNAVVALNTTQAQQIAALTARIEALEAE